MTSQDVAMAITRAMTPDDRREFLREMVRLNPPWRGAGVADFLDSLYQTDARLDLVEPFAAAHPDPIVPMALPRVMPMTTMAAYVAIYAHGATTPEEIWVVAERILKAVTA